MARLTNAGSSANTLKTLVAKVIKLEKQVTILMEAKNEVAAPLATAKKIETCTVNELKVLCEDKGIDYTDFKVKADYIEALK